MLLAPAGRAPNPQPPRPRVLSRSSWARRDFPRQPRGSRASGRRTPWRCRLGRPAPAREPRVSRASEFRGTALGLPERSQRDALDAVGAAGIEGALGNEVVVVGAYFSDSETRGFDRVDVATAWDRPCDAGRPKLDVAPGALLQRPAADDVGDGEPSTGPKHTCRFGEDPVLDRGEVDHSVRDDDVEGRVLEGESVDACFEELDLGEPVAISQADRLGDLLVREVDSNHAPSGADLEGGAERICSGA